ncbi:MAG: type II toxin-antitoxin system VapC family toxin [Thermoprotei archaeon]
MRRLEEKSLKILKGNYILTLTIYEIGNALWRETKLLKRLTVNNTVEILKAVIALTKFMQIIEPENPIEVLVTSNMMEATFYDTAYVITALQENLILVTDDEKLIAKIEKYQDMILEKYKRKIRVIESTDL